MINPKLREKILKLLQPIQGGDEVRKKLAIQIEKMIEEEYIPKKDVFVYIWRREAAEWLKGAYKFIGTEPAIDSLIKELERRYDKP